MTAEQADSIFFPGSGGKPTKAEAYCGSVSCPVMDLCLINAIECNLKGFWAGTTEEQRRTMAREFHIKPKIFDEFMPPEPVRKRAVYRRIEPSVVLTTVEFLMELEAPF